MCVGYLKEEKEKSNLRCENSMKLINYCSNTGAYTINTKIVKCSVTSVRCRS